MEARLLPCGERAVLVEVPDLASVLALGAAVNEHAAAARAGAERPIGAGGSTPAGAERPIGAGGSGWARVADVVPASRTVLVTVDEPAALATLRSALERLLAGLATPGAGGLALDRGGCTTPVEVPVVYDGPDLAEVGRLTGLGTDGVVAAHTGRDWVVAFSGFAPGFPYLVGGDPRLEVPRRDRPRARVEPGSVGLAGEYSGIYPTASPGGWRIVGRTDAVLWDVDRDPPALLAPGATVRFVDAVRR